MKFDYDVVLSFAGEDRSYVEQVADILVDLGIRVFYDKYEECNLWGRDLYTHLDDVYQHKSRYCIIFISKYYKEKLWTNYERESAQARAFKEKGEYILPVRFDDTELPGIRPTIGYLRADTMTPEQLAYLVAKKVNPELDVERMIQYLKDQLPGYSIRVKGRCVVFESKEEDYYGEFSLRLLLEMYKIDQLDYMFVFPAIVPN